MFGKWMGFLVVLALTACGGREVMVASDSAAGFAPGTFVTLDAAVDKAVREGRVPGAVLAIGRGGALVYEHASGYRDLTTDPIAPMTVDTVFDVASLTKPVATSTAAALLICRGDLPPDKMVYRHTIDQHLRHATDMPPYMDWHVIEPARSGATPVETMVRILDDDLHGARRYRSFGYSNLGYVLAGAAIEQQAGMDMESLLRPTVWGPLGMNTTTFRPNTAKLPVARTAKDQDPGRPFDQLADYLMANWPGHVPGHSGLFSTGKDLTRFSQALMNPQSSKVPEMACIANYLLNGKTPAGTQRANDVGFSSGPGRTPAFDTDSMSPGKKALVHTGYTGAMIWIDPASGTPAVLLTNSVHGETEGWNDLRRDVVRAIWRGLGE